MSTFVLNSQRGKEPHPPTWMGSRKKNGSLLRKEYFKVISTQTYH